MKVIIVEPLKEPYAIDFDFNDKTIEELIGGIPHIYGPFRDGGTAIVYNHKDEGMPSPLPFLGPRTEEERKRYELWRGTYIVCKFSEDASDFVSFTDKELKLYIRRLSNLRKKYGIVRYFTSVMRQLDM